jgi:hypothetical protein
MMNDKPATLKTGKYVVDIDGGGTHVYAVDPEKRWIATVSDPQTAMDVVEGLIMVETKRFYHPGTKPVFKTEEEKAQPPFLKIGD